MATSLNILAWMPGPGEMVVILVVALIFFGRRLPDVARSLGKSIVEFKKGLRVQDDVTRAGPGNDEKREYAIPLVDRSAEKKHLPTGEDKPSLPGA